MSKAILVLDRFPESCVDCDFFTDEDGTIDFKCSLTGRTNLATLHERFSDCPLKEMPDRMHMSEICSDEGEDGWSELVSFYSGWNHCLDAIIGQED